MDALKTKGQMYDQINLQDQQKSGFDLSYYSKGTGRLGRIIPTRCLEVLPGDSMTGKSSAALQFEPLAVPILSNMDVRQEHFYVPNRILWKNWESFITGGRNMDDTSVLPTVSLYSICQAYWSTNGLHLPTVGEYMTINKIARPGTSYSGTLKNLFYITVKNDATFENRIKDIASNQQVSDLFKPMLQKWHDIVSYVNNCTFTYAGKTYKGVPLFDTSDATFAGYVSRVTGGDPRSFSGYKLTDLAANLPQMVRDAIIPGMVQSLNGVGAEVPTNGFNKLGQIPMLSSEFQSYLNMEYDLYAELIGVGSTLDFLGYPIVRPLDFFINSITTLFSYYTVPSDDLPIEITGFRPTIWTSPSNQAKVNDVTYSKQNKSVLPLRANYMIWYNYYRDQLLETVCPEPSDSDIVTANEIFHLVIPRQRCWAKDTFTTALANTGTGSMVVPVNSAYNQGSDFVWGDIVKTLKVNGADADSADIQGITQKDFYLSDGTKIELPTRFLTGNHSTYDTAAGDILSGGFSLDTLNRAQRMQKWLMKNLIYGNRIQDSLYTHFGVKSSDARLDLPEYISGSRTMVQIDTVLNNTSTQESIAGEKFGNAYSYDKGSEINKFSEEHGLLMSYLTVMPFATYSYGENRLYSKLNKFDFAWPEFAQLGMDAVYNSELSTGSLSIADSNSNKVFGYQGRYYDYKCHQDEEHGELLTTQDMYTFGREFSLYDPDKMPKLNYEFVHCWPALDMFVADKSDVNQFRYDIDHSLGMSRVLPVCGTNL